MEKLVGSILLSLLRPIAIALLLMRKVSRRLLLLTQRDYFLIKRTGTLRYKIVGRLRAPFELSVDEMSLTWYGKKTVKLLISDLAGISLCQARVVTLAQRIDSVFAEQLFLLMTPDATMTADEIRRNCNA